MKAEQLFHQTSFTFTDPLQSLFRALVNKKLTIYYIINLENVLEFPKLITQSLFSKSFFN